jgi:hypothetical protein
VKKKGKERKGKGMEGKRAGRRERDHWCVESRSFQSSKRFPEKLALPIKQYTILGLGHRKSSRLPH